MTAPPPVRARWKARLFTLIVGAAVAVGLAAYLHDLQSSLVSAARAQAMLDASRPPRPVADVAQAVRAMKLVTVEIDTTVKVERTDESWRGDVAVAIEAPVRLSYGVDLSRLSVDSVTFKSLLGGRPAYQVRIPRPTRIATEVFHESTAPLVQLGWLRLRSRAGEYYLSQARKDLTDEARELVLLPEDAARVEQVTRQQVERLVRTLVGDEADVTVEFEDAE
jgi:hypothetical protein